MAASTKQPIVGQPSLNPPPGKAAMELSDATGASDLYDVLINNGSTTVGFMLWRNQEMSAPSEHYKSEALDYTYTPTFIHRTSVSGDYGDNVQDFYMTFVQRDWSGGVGQKYFRQQAERERQFFDGSNIKPTLYPGVVTIGPNENTQAYQLTDATNAISMMMSYYRASGDPNSAGAGIPDCLVKFEGSATTTLAAYLSFDGGQSWQAIALSSSSTIEAMYDMIVGDDGYVYMLDADANVVYRLLGLNPSLSQTLKTLTISGFSPYRLFYYNGSLNALCQNQTSLATSIQILTATTNTLTGASVHSFNNATIIDVLVANGVSYFLVLDLNGNVILYEWDGTNVYELSRLPIGWHTNFTTETSVSSPLLPQYQITYADGVIYVAGLMPARDYVQAGGVVGSSADQKTFRTTLWYYAEGNTGIVWQGDTIRNAYIQGGSPTCVRIHSNQIAFTDVINHKLMVYDPGTGGVYPLSRISTQPSTVRAPDQTGNYRMYAGAAYTSSATVVQINCVSVVPDWPVGSVFQFAGSSEQIRCNWMVTQGATTNAFVNQYNVTRGWNGTTPVSIASGATVATVTPPAPRIHRLVYDASKSILHACWYDDISQSGTIPQHIGYTCYHTYWSLVQDAVLKNSAAVVSSNFDFDSSLEKYFKGLMVDFDTDPSYGQIANLQPGTVDIWYMLNGVNSIQSASSSDLTAAGYTLLQANAQPGVFYNVNAQGLSISVVAVLNPPPLTGGNTASQGPVLKRVAVKGAPILPGYRNRLYQFALVSGLALKNGQPEPLTPAQLRKNVETMISTNVPVTVSDAGMDNVTMVFLADQCKIREIEPNEYVAFLSMREV